MEIESRRRDVNDSSHLLTEIAFCLNLIIFYSGWEPVVEMEPHVDENLLEAIEKLGGKDLVSLI